MQVLVTQHSTYLLNPDLQLLLQVPGGTECGMEQGVWHRVLLDRVPRPGEPLFCSFVASGGETIGLRTSAIRWMGPPPEVPALIDLARGLRAPIGAGR